MATVQLAYFKGRRLDKWSVGVGKLRVQEDPREGNRTISIDLYHFEGDGKPVCEGLTFDQAGKDGKRRAFCIAYNPDDEDTPLWILCCDDEGSLDSDADMLPEYIPEEVLQAITAWLESQMPMQNEADSQIVNRKSSNCKCRNDVTSFFYYMWNKWDKTECQRVFGDAPGGWEHYWSKWCYFAKQDVRGAAERFYAELDTGNRDRLVRRALECYDGMRNKKP